MNTILQKRIEEAAKESVLEEIPPYIPSDFVNDSELECAYERAQEIFISGANFALQNQWISVEEALPKVNELVFGCVNDEGTPQAVGMAYYDGYGGWHYSDEEEISLITHWMQIPSLKGGEK